MSPSFDAIIVGAGVVGSSLGATLGRQGRKILLIERDWAEPDRIVGELLQPGGVKSLEKLGLRDCLDGIDAIPAVGYTIIFEGAPLAIPYAENPEKPGTSLEGRSFHHGRFISKLRDAAKSTPNVTCLESTVNELIADQETGQVVGIRCTSKNSDVSEFFYAPVTIVADGTFSKFRKDYIPKKVQIRSHFVGLVLKNADIPSPHHGHVILGGNHFPILVYQIGTDETRMLIDIQGKLPSAGNGDLKEYLRATVTENVPKSLLPSFQRAIEEDRLRSMPNSYLPPSANEFEGVLFLGDSYNMRHPLTGGGMTVAFNDVVLVSELLSPASVPDLNDSGLVAAKLNEFYWKRKSLSTVINVLAQALYAIFAANDSQLRLLQQGCFQYLSRGGYHMLEPVGLLSGLIPFPLVLVNHFYQVAFYTIFIMFRDAPSVFMYPFIFLRALSVLWKASIVVLPVIFSELMFCRLLINHLVLITNLESYFPIVALSRLCCLLFY
ncbi:squalene epoxidase-domain-containing protein [Lipomyces oligophaga]|uniref:squalene epoxidase-domain-containing protein n=1 Tax=Lipomyces oligophaga TaxID=45792 RepID=UPI0034CF88E1